MQTTVMLTINAPAEAVFKLLTEPDQVRRWMPSIESTETISTPDDGSVAGTRFRQRICNAHSVSLQTKARFSTFEGVISEFEPSTLRRPCGEQSVPDGEPLRIDSRPRRLD